MRNSFWYWMKDTGQTAEEARDELATRLIEINRDVIVSSGMTSEPAIARKADHFILEKKYSSRFIFTSVFINGNEVSDCVQKPSVSEASWSNCQIWARIFLPKKVKFDFEGKEGRYWFFSAEDEVLFNALKFESTGPSGKLESNKSFKFNELAILDGISKKIGDGFFIYIAPNTINVSTDKKVSYPLLLENGDHLLFVHEKNK
jgi:hypothetical protein